MFGVVPPPISNLHLPLFEPSLPEPPSVPDVPLLPDVPEDPETPLDPDVPPVDTCQVALPLPSEVKT